MMDFPALFDCQKVKPVEIGGFTWFDLTKTRMLWGIYQQNMGIIDRQITNYSFGYLVDYPSCRVYPID